MGCFHRATPVGAGDFAYGDMVILIKNCWKDDFPEELSPRPPKYAKWGVDPSQIDGTWKKSGTLKVKDLVGISNLMDSCFVYTRQLWFWKAQNWRKRICELANCNMSSILSLRGVWTLWTPQKWSGFRPQSKVELASKGPKWYATVAVYPANMI